MKFEASNSEIETIYIGNNERVSGKISPENLKKGLEQFHKNGLFVLGNAIEFSQIDHVRERMLQDLNRNLQIPNVHFNHGRGNVTQTPPLLPEYLHSGIWANEFAVSLMEHIIGPRPQLSFATSNIALPMNQGRQAVHSDYYCNHFDFPVFLEVNIYLDNVSPLNGSTEIWPGTHNGYNKKDHSFSDMGWIKREVFCNRAKVCPPCQLSISKGSLVVRDLRVWHAGMSNRTSIPRIMLGFIYNPQWFGSQMRMILPFGARKCLDEWKHIDYLADFTEDATDYLYLQQELILTQEYQKQNFNQHSENRKITAGPEHYWSPTH